MREPAAAGPRTPEARPRAARPKAADTRPEPGGFRFGIEHEVAFLGPDGTFADFTTTRFEDFQRIVDALPSHPEDAGQLRVGDAGIKEKRWYVEGFERFADSPQPIDCVPKGIEVRTSIHRTIAGAVDELRDSLALLRKAAAAAGYTAVRVSFNPLRTAYVPDPPLNDYELAQRATSPEMRTADITVLTYGPDLNMSHASFGAAEVRDATRKLTAYSPFIVPFSFGSPFFGGTLWDGLSPRTFQRTGRRPAALGYVPGDEIATDRDDEPDRPSLIRAARLPAEVGRIEFKAFDTCTPDEYGPLLALVKGIVADNTLRARADAPDTALHRRAARHAFDDPMIVRGARAVLDAAQRALRDDADVELLDDLRTRLDNRRTPAHALVERFRQVGDLVTVLDELTDRT